MSGAVEEGGKVATGLIEGLKQEPAVLSLVTVIIVFVAAVLWATISQRQLDHEQMKMMLDQNAKMSEWLYRCTSTMQHTEDIPLPPIRPPEFGPSRTENDPT